MPFQSKAQVRAFFAKEHAGELPKGTAKRWLKHTKTPIKSLPEHVKKEALDAVADLLLSQNWIGFPDGSVFKLANAVYPVPRPLQGPSLAPTGPGMTPMPSTVPGGPQLPTTPLGTGLDAGPATTQAAALPGVPGHAATNTIDRLGGLDPRGVTVDGNNAAGIAKGAEVKIAYMVTLGTEKRAMRALGSALARMFSKAPAASPTASPLAIRQLLPRDTAAPRPNTFAQQARTPPAADARQVAMPDVLLPNSGRPRLPSSDEYLRQARAERLLPLRPNTGGRRTPDGGDYIPEHAGWAAGYNERELVGNSQGWLPLQARSWYNRAEHGPHSNILWSPLRSGAPAVSPAPPRAPRAPRAPSEPASGTADVDIRLPWYRRYTGAARPDSPLPDATNGWWNAHSDRHPRGWSRGARLGTMAATVGGAGTAATFVPWGKLKPERVAPADGEDPRVREARRLQLRRAAVAADNEFARAAEQNPILFNWAPLAAIGAEGLPPRDDPAALARWATRQRNLADWLELRDEADENVRVNGEGRVAGPWPGVLPLETRDIRDSYPPALQRRPAEPP